MYTSQKEKKRKEKKSIAVYGHLNEGGHSGATFYEVLFGSDLVTTLAMNCSIPWAKFSTFSRTQSLTEP
jgi:hypothetical protein